MIDWIDIRHPKRPEIGDRVIIRWRWYDKVYFDIDVVEGIYHAEYGNSCLMTRDKEALFTDDDFFIGENLVTHWAPLNEPQIIMQRNANPSYLFFEDYKYELLSVAHKENRYDFIIESHDSKIYTESVVTYKGNIFKVKLTDRCEVTNYVTLNYLSNFGIKSVTRIIAEKGD